MRQVAKRGDRDTLPCPEQREWFDLSLALTRDEASRIQAGFVPQGSDDRWFLFVEDGVLYCHRGWTGECIFGVRLEPGREGAVLARAWVTRNRAVYDSDGIESDHQLLVDLVRSHLLDAR